MEQGKVNNEAEEGAEEATQLKALEQYQEMFNIKRREQMNVAENIFAKPDYSDRYKMTRRIVDGIFQSLEHAKKNLSDVDLDSLPPVPARNSTALEAVITLYENTAFLGDLALRLPDIVHEFVDTKSDRLETAKFALNFCSKSAIFEGTQETHIKLTLQELGLAEEPDPNYVNPFSEKNIQEKKKLHDQEQEAKRKAADREERKRERRPKLSVRKEPTSTCE